MGKSHHSMQAAAREAWEVKMAEQKNMQQQDINQLLKVRHDKLAQLQQAGKDPFRITKFTVSISLPSGEVPLRVRPAFSKASRKKKVKTTQREPGQVRA